MRITVARQSRGRRLLVIAMLFTLPIVIAVLGRHYDVNYKADEVENVLIFGMIFQALVPLTALLFASGMVQDDIEEQTLTYLLIRPVPRWAIYLAKLMATFLVAVVRAVLFTTATLIVIHWDEQNLWKTVVLGRAPLIAALLALCLSAYVAIFGGLSLWVRRTLVIGAIYIVVFEGVLANIDFVVRSVDGHVLHPGLERAMAGSTRRRLVDRSGDRPHGLHLLDHLADRDRASSRSSAPGASAHASSGSRLRRGAE